MWRLSRYMMQWQNLLGLGIVLLFIGLAIAAPILAPRPLNLTGNDLGPLPIAPGRSAPLGTVPVASGNIHLDVFKMLVWGSTTALKFGVTISLITNLIGVLIGATSGYFGGWINEVSMRVTDAFLTFPVVAGVALFQSIFFSSENLNPLTPVESFLQTLGLDSFIMALILFSWMPAARLTNSIVLEIIGNEYNQAARALGASPFWIILRHLIPNSVQPSIVLFARDIGMVVLLQAGFTFIGLTSGSPWGEVLSVGRRWIFGLRGDIISYWWTFLPVTLAIVIFGIGWNLLGDGLNDWLNPRQE